MIEKTFDAVIENIDAVTEFINEQLETFDCPMKMQMKIDVAIDEIVSNIAFYAYDDFVGKVTLQIKRQEEPLAVVLTFIDHGKPYNPLDKKDPNVKLSVEEKTIGGLGIYMVKKLMDDVRYEYRDGQNVLKIMKKFD